MAKKFSAHFSSIFMYSYSLHLCGGNLFFKGGKGSGNFLVCCCAVQDQSQCSIFVTWSSAAYHNFSRELQGVKQLWNHNHTAITASITFLGCLSYINVTKECYQIGLSNKVLHPSLVNISFIRRPTWLHSWHFYHNHATKELLHGQMCKTKANNINWFNKLFNYTLNWIISTLWTSCVTHIATEVTKIWL